MGKPWLVNDIWVISLLTTTVAVATATPFAFALVALGENIDPHSPGYYRYLTLIPLAIIVLAWVFLIRSLRR